jgi:hypothetical protein
MASRRVYWITLRVVLGAAKAYIQHNQLRLQQNLSVEQYNCVVDTLTAIVTCLSALPVQEPGP